MIGGVAQGSCELQIIEARRNTKPRYKCSHVGTTFISKFAEEEELRHCRFASG